MGKEIVYCSVCGDRIDSADFEKGRATTVLKRNFCRKCSTDVVNEASQGPQVDHSATPPPLKIRTRRAPSADKPTPRIKLPMPYLVAIGVGIFALALLWFVLSRKG